MGGWSNWRKFKFWQSRSAEAPRPPTQLSAAGQGLLFTSTKLHVRPAFKFFPLSSLALVIIGSLRNDDDDDGDGNESGKKSNRFRQAKQRLCTCITLSWTFLCRRCTTTTWNCHISRFVEDGNTRQQLSFPELWSNPLEFNFKKICHHLTN